MSYQVIFFDLDNTLYPPECGLWEVIGDRIALYMLDRLHIPAAEVLSRREHYFRSFGTTLNGLMQDYRVDPQDYMDFVHDLPLEDYLQPDPALTAMLVSMPQHKFIFTNADATHARRVLDRLGVREQFAGVVDLFALGMVNKPRPESYRTALALAGSPDPAVCVLVEDTLNNLAPAHEMGMTTVYLGPALPDSEVDVSLTRLTHLCRALPALGCHNA